MIFYQNSSCVIFKRDLSAVFWSIRNNPERCLPFISIATEGWESH